MQTNFLRFILVLIAAVSVFTSTTKAETTLPIPLPCLVKDRFGNLSSAEKRLVKQATEGEAADCMDLSGDDKNIRGDLFSWLCTDPQATAQLTYRGISLVGAEIAGEVNLEWAKISFPIKARQCVFRDAIILSNSHVAFLSLEGSSVTSLTADSTHFDGGVHLGKGFRAEGEVHLSAATIEGNLDCECGQFISKGDAINANSAKINGDVIFRHVVVEGDVIFTYGYVANKFEWRRVKLSEKAKLDLRFTRVGTLWNDDQDSWPTRGKLLVGGFVYDQVHDPTPATKAQLREVQLGWLQRQPQDRFLSQPFEQLAAVLRKMGHDEDAKLVMIAKNDSEAKHTPLRFNRIGDWTWFKIVGARIGYGYTPWSAFGYSLIVIGIGWLLFRRGYRRGLVTPTGDTKYTVETDGAHPSSGDYPNFNAFVYSLETFVPLVKLGLGDHWTPNANRGESLRLGIVGFPRTGGWLRGYLWIHIILGWVLTTLWVGGLTGLVKT